MTSSESRSKRKWPPALVALAFVALVGASRLFSVDPVPRDAAEPVVMVAENGNAYLVAPWETLGEAMYRKAVVDAPRCEGPAKRPTFSQAEEQGPCVPEDLKNKPKDAVACKCYEETECNGTESHQCERHCRKDLCNCCSI
jgi:hypothetical protein